MRTHEHQNRSHRWADSRGRSSDCWIQLRQPVPEPRSGNPDCPKRAPICKCRVFFPVYAVADVIVPLNCQQEYRTRTTPGQ